MLRVLDYLERHGHPGLRRRAGRRSGGTPCPDRDQRSPDSSGACDHGAEDQLPACRLAATRHDGSVTRFRPRRDPPGLAVPARRGRSGRCAAARRPLGRGLPDRCGGIRQELRPRRRSPLGMGLDRSDSPARVTHACAVHGNCRGAGRARHSPACIAGAGASTSGASRSARREDLRARWSPEGKLIVGFVGKELAPEKHVDRLESLAQNPRIQLVIVGDGPGNAPTSSVGCLARSSSRPNSAAPN